MGLSVKAGGLGVGVGGSRCGFVVWGSNILCTFFWWGSCFSFLERGVVGGGRVWHRI